jgi:hypothetical protein
LYLPFPSATLCQFFASHFRVISDYATLRPELS